MSTTTNRQILLVKRPVGHITDDCFERKESPLPEAGAGQLLLRTLYLSLDPAMRGWMNDTDSYIAPVGLGDVMRGSTIAQVVASNADDFAPGDIVFGSNGWQEYAVAQPQDLHKLPTELGLPLTNFLSVLGITGLTAYFGMLDIGQPREGETVVVSTAAGAVGSIAGQLAKIKGSRTVGLAGTDAKCAWCVEELGYDACINYKDADWKKQLAAACPNGVDVYFDNVGGEMLNTVLGMNKFHSRFAICGAISQYNNTEAAPGPSNYIRLLTKSSRMEGFIVLDFADRFMEGIMQLGQWLMEGKIRHREEVIEGLENAPRAIHKLFEGSNTGKLIVKVADAE